MDGRQRQEKMVVKASGNIWWEMVRINQVKSKFWEKCKNSSCTLWSKACGHLPSYFCLVLFFLDLVGPFKTTVSSHIMRQITGWQCPCAKTKFSPSVAAANPASSGKLSLKSGCCYSNRVMWIILRNWAVTYGCNVQVSIYRWGEYVRRELLWNLDISLYCPESQDM